MRVRAGGPSLNQPVFYWRSKDNYAELKEFEAEVMNILLTTQYTIIDENNLLIINNWLYREGFQFIKKHLKIFTRVMPNSSRI